MAIDYDNLYNQYAKTVDTESSNQRKRVRQLASARAAGAGLSSASLGTDTSGIDESIANQAISQKSRMKGVFLQMQASEQARKEAEDRARRAQAKQALWGALGSLAGGVAGSFLGPAGAVGGEKFGNWLFSANKPANTTIKGGIGDYSSL
jgi:hypothetical protein